MHYIMCIILNSSPCFHIKMQMYTKYISNWPYFPTKDTRLYNLFIIMSIYLLALFTCPSSGRSVGMFPTSIRETDPLFSSLAPSDDVMPLAENLLANFNAFGDSRSRNVLGIISDGLLTLHGSSVHRASGVTLWMTRTPNLTMHLRFGRSSSGSPAARKKIWINDG